MSSEVPRIKIPQRATLSTNDKNKESSSEKQSPTKRLLSKPDLEQLRTLEKKVDDYRARLASAIKGLEMEKESHNRTKEKLLAVESEVFDAELGLCRTQAAHRMEIEDLNRQVNSQQMKVERAYAILDEEKTDRAKRSKADYDAARKRAEQRAKEEVRKLKREALRWRRKADEE